MLTLTRRLLIAAALAAGVSSSAWSQTYPTRDVRFIIPYAPGGITDLLGRKVAQALSVTWRQSVVVENHPGAGGNLAAQLAARAAPDGYTLFMGFLGTHAANISLYPRLGYDPVRDFTPISLIANAPAVLTIHPSVPAKTAQEFIAYARANPGKLNFGSSGTAGASHFALEIFKSMTKVDIVHVPYKGTAPVMTDLLPGRIQGYFDVPITAAPNVEAGRIRALLVADTHRSARLPNVPTSAEVGLPDYLLTTWLGLLASGTLPAPLTAKLNRDVVTAVRSPEFEKWCADQGLTPIPSTSDEFARFMASETKRFAQIIREANVKLD